MEPLDDMKSFRKGKPITPREAILDGFSYGMVKDGQAMLEIRINEKTIQQFTMYLKDRETFMARMTEIAELIYEEDGMTFKKGDVKDGL